MSIFCNPTSRQNFAGASAQTSFPISDPYTDHADLADPAHLLEVEKGENELQDVLSSKNLGKLKTME